jgi:Predicted transcriptional regulators
MLAKNEKFGKQIQLSVEELLHIMKDISGIPPSLRVQNSPAYDMLQSLLFIANPSKNERWQVWAEQTIAQLRQLDSGDEQQQLWQRIVLWFRGDFSLGAVCIPLIPLLPQPTGIEELLSALATLPLPDFLRSVITISPTNPDTPLDPATLLSLCDQPAQARAFTTTYLRFTGKQRNHLLQILADPEGARQELIDLLIRYDELIYARLDPQIQQERAQAAERLQAMIVTQHVMPGIQSSLFNTLHNLQDFSPVVLAPSVFQSRGVRSYLHEIHRSLFDGQDFEPYILIVSTQEILGKQQRRRKNTVPAQSSDPAERWTNGFKALADPSRLRMLHLLAQRPYYQQELAVVLQMNAATITHHLTALAHAGFIRLERQAHRTYLVLQPEILRTFLHESQAYILTGQQATDQSETGQQVIGRLATDQQETDFTI